MNTITIPDSLNQHQELKQYSLSDILDKFFLSINISEETKKMYRYSLNRFFIWLQSQNITNPSEEHLIQYINSDIFKENQLPYKKDSKTPTASATHATYLAAIKRFFKWLYTKKIYQNITDGIEIIKERDSNCGHVRKALQKHEIRLLLDSIDMTKINGLRDYAIITLMAGTGIREVEVHRSNIEDVKMSSQDISDSLGKVKFYIQRKRKKTKEGWVILTDKVLQSIQNYLSHRSQSLPSDQLSLHISSCPLFVTHGNKSRNKRMSIKSIQDMIYERMKKAGIKRPGICGHSIRHFFGTQLAEKGVPIKQVQMALGHSSQNTTEIYTRGIDRLKHPVEEMIEF